MDPDRYSVLLYRTCLLGCLLGVIATLYFLGGLAGALHHPVSNLAVAAGVIVAALFFLYAFAAALPRGSCWGIVLWVLTVFVVLVTTVLGLLPPTARDELTHHLALPRLYAEAGRLVELPFAPYSYYPMLLDMLYVPWVQWGWDSAPKLIHGLFGVLTGLLVYAYLALRLSPIYGLLGFFLFVFTPAILRLSHWAYVDLGVTFYSTAALLCLIQRIEGRELRMENGEWRIANGERSIPNSQFAIRNSFRNPQSAIRHFQFPWLVLAGLLTGFALATKPNGLLIFLLVFFLLFFLLGNRVERGVVKAAGEVVLFLSLAIIAVSPWWIRNWAWTGNPLFPFFSGYLGGAIENGGGGGPDIGLFGRRAFLYGESWWQIALLPVRIFFSGQDDQPQYFDGVLNPLLVLFLPWAFKGKWSVEKKLLFTFAALYLTYAVFLVEMRIRYILPIVPPLVVLAVYGVHNIYLRIRRPWILFAALLVLLLPNGVYLWRHFERVSALDFLRGKESREAYLARVVPDYAVFKYVNEHLPAKAKIYLLFMGRRAYYCRRDCFHDPGDNPWILVRMVRQAESGGKLNAKLRDRGITHLLIRDELFARFMVNNLSPEQLSVWNSFAREHLRGLFNVQGYSVFGIYG